MNCCPVSLSSLFAIVSVYPLHVLAGFWPLVAGRLLQAPGFWQAATGY